MNCCPVCPTYQNTVASSVAPQEIVFATETNESGTTYVRQGCRTVDLSLYPATIGSLTRKIYFKAVLQNSVNTVDYNAEVRLFDNTNAVAITSSTLDNTGAVDRSVAAEYTTAELTVGSAAGDLRNDVVALYSVQFRAVGTPEPPTEFAVLGSAYLQIVYE